MNGPNTTFTYGQTFKAEDRDENYRFVVTVDDDAAFDAAAKAERDKKEWHWNPDETQTQCSAAGWNSIAAGGVNGKKLKPISNLTWPGNVGDWLKKMTKTGGVRVE